MKHTHTIFAPQLSPIHFSLLEQVFQDLGYDFRVLPTVSPRAVELGLRYVNNDLCYPCIMTTGQMLEAALESPELTNKEIAFIITQTGGGCRASSYPSVMRKALEDAGRSDIPVIPLALSSLASLRLVGLAGIRSLLYAAILGDVLMTCLHRIRPYEATKGSCDEMLRWLLVDIRGQLGSMGESEFIASTHRIVRHFASCLPPHRQVRRPRIGVVGEILLKYHPDGNNHLVDQIETGGCEAVVSPFIDFFLYCLTGPIFQNKLLGTPSINAAIARPIVAELERLKALAAKAFYLSRATDEIHWRSIYELSELARPHISLAQSMGEGWLMCAEMAELAETGCRHIVVAQPFACLPNHAVAAGVVKSLQSAYPGLMVNVVDYDPGASKVNQRNRLQMVLNNALNGQGAD